MASWRAAIVDVWSLGNVGSLSSLPGVNLSAHFFLLQRAQNGLHVVRVMAQTCEGMQEMDPNQLRVYYNVIIAIDLVTK